MLFELVVRSVGIKPGILLLQISRAQLTCFGTLFFFVFAAVHFIKHILIFIFIYAVDLILDISQFNLVSLPLILIFRN